MLRANKRLVAALIALAFLSITTGATAAPWFGYSDNYEAKMTLSASAGADLAARSGATSYRYTLDWTWVEGTRGQYVWTGPDDIYAQSIQRGIRPLIVFMGAPKWARELTATCSTCKYPPARNHNADWQNIIRRVAARYPLAAGIEIWNEPNMRWAWWSGPDPARYAELLKLAYDAVRSVDRSMPVIGGALAAEITDTSTRDVIGIRPFLQAMYDHGARGRMDGISLHPYPGDVDFWRAFAAISIVKETRTVNGDDVPVWVTETGMTNSGSTPSSEYEQGITLPALYDSLRRDPEIAGIYVHALLDDPTSSNIDEHGVGVLRVDRTPKPAYCGLAAVNATGWTCSEPFAAAVPPDAQVRRWQAQTLLQAAADAARQVHVARGAYATVTAADLNAIDPRISAAGLPSNVTPGEAADPAQVGVWPVKSGDDAILLCNASTADRSYCIRTTWAGQLRYGSMVGTVYATAGAMMHGTLWTW